MNNQTLIENLRCIPDFPKKGINFRDVTTLYKNAECMKIMLDEMYELYKDKGITKIVGIESRGFIMASALAGKLGCGVVLARKPGKLPGTVIKEQFSKEYGVDTIEMHLDSIEPDDVVLIHDDLLATGGTAKATYKLVEHFNPKKVYMNFIIEIKDEGLHGRDLFEGIELTGSYQYYDAEGTIIYVGKAKNLKSRVSSYFHTEVDRFKTKVLVSKIWDISYTVVNTEEDALLLENSLIKKYNPRYNVLLKDGKTYPSICVTKEYLHQQKMGNLLRSLLACRYHARRD